MKEAEWLASQDPLRMLRYLFPAGGSAMGLPIEYLTPRPSARKLRLFAAACYWTCAMQADAASCGGTRAALEAEEWAEGMPPPTLPNVVNLSLESNADPVEHARSACQWGEYHHKCLPLKASLLREIVGNPFRPIVLGREWINPDILRLAEAVYQERVSQECSGCKGTGRRCGKTVIERHPGPNDVTYSECTLCKGTGVGMPGCLDNASLAVLSDAIEEAGCTEPAILEHLRSPGRSPFDLSGPHVRGCWCLDTILGRS